VRIALIGPAHPYKGGGARHTTELAHRLAAAGHNVVIESWRAQYPRRLYPGRQTLDVPEGTPYPRTYRRLAWYRPDGWVAAGRRLRSADLVIFALLTPLQVPSYLAILAGLGGRPGRPRTVVICHNVLPHERRPGDVALVRTLLSQVDTVIVHSAAQAAEARDLAPDLRIIVARMPPHLPVPARLRIPVRRAEPAVDDEDHFPERPVVLPPGQADAGGQQCRLLFFGIVRPYKGLDVLLRAMARTPAHVTLTVAGEFWGGTGGTQKLIAELGLPNRVTLRPGYLPAREIPALFEAADALVLPYREATASQNVLLSFSHGVPVITTTAGALAEAVRDGVDGLTCRPGDVDDLARALEAISVPETARLLRSGVRAPDPEPYWAAYLQAVLATGGRPPRTPPLGGTRPPEPPSAGTRPPEPPSAGTHPPEPPSAGTHPPEPPSAGTRPPEPPSAGTRPPEPPSAGTRPPEPPG
jgi:glycosyltransferase involved in cell wall biosynthesis